MTSSPVQLCYTEGNKKLDDDDTGKQALNAAAYQQSELGKSISDFRCDKIADKSN